MSENYDYQHDNKEEEECEIRNQACVELELCGKKRKLESNEVKAEIINIKITKEQSCGFVFKGDEVEYTIKICNESNVDLYDLEFKDNIAKSTEYEPGSFKVNGKKENPDVDDHTIEYEIPELKAKEEIVITFEVKVK